MKTLHCVGLKSKSQITLHKSEVENLVMNFTKYKYSILVYLLLINKAGTEFNI